MGLEAKVPRTIVLVGLAKSRLSEIVEGILPAYDSAVLAEHSSLGLAKLVWCLTRVKPNTKMSDLRVETYEALISLLIKAHKRVVSSTGQSKYEDCISGFLGPSPTEQKVSELAISLGYEDSWSVPVKVAPKAKAKAAIAPAPAALPAAPLLPGAVPLPAAVPAAPAPAPPAQPAPVVGGPALAEVLGQMQQLQQQLQQLQQQQPLQQPLEPLPAVPAAAVLAAQEAAAPEGEPAAAASGAEPAAAVAEERALPAAATQICVICQCMFAAEPLEALQCGHVFHQYCLQMYCEVTARPLQDCCPFKCGQPPLPPAAAALQAALQPAPAPAEPAEDAPPLPPAAPEGVAELAAAVAAQAAQAAQAAAAALADLY